MTRPEPFRHCRKAVPNLSSCKIKQWNWSVVTLARDHQIELLTVLLEGGDDPAQYGSTGEGSWATQAGDLGVKATFDHSSGGAADSGLRSGLVTRYGWSGQMTNEPSAVAQTRRQGTSRRRWSQVKAHFFQESHIVT